MTFEIEGTAFLPHQVRRTAGAIVEVGRGKLAPERFRQWLETPETNAAGPAAPRRMPATALSVGAPVSWKSSWGRHS